jgi:lipopolysaccharide export system permease protein
MIFRRSLLLELTWVAMGLFVVLLLIILSSQIVRLLGQASMGALASSSVWAMMGFAAIRYLPTLFSLMLFISVLTVMTRLWRDSEMVIWFASGQSIRSFIVPILRFAIPVVVVIAVLGLFVSPWAMQKSREYRENALRREQVTQISPGVFRESGGAKRVYFIEDFSADTGQGNNVFVQLKRDDGRIAVIVARRGGLHVDELGDNWLWLEGGRSYEGTPGSAEYDIMEFGSARLRLTLPSRSNVNAGTQAMPTLDLIRSNTPEHRGEFEWRIAMPIAALLLSLAAIPLAFFNPRGGRTFNLLIAIALAFLYFNLLNIFQAWIVLGKIPLWLGMWPLHGSAALGVWALFKWRSRAK